MSVPFLCPLCGSALDRIGGQAKCEKGHSYDYAREGYLYLLPGGGMHGDGKEMIAARHRLLESGCYQPLRDAVADILAPHAPFRRLLDAGCGEGYYTEKAAALACEITGVDLSKDGVRAAAKRFRGADNAHFAVASVYRLPMADASVDLLLSIFSPFAADEFSRVLRPGGLLLSVIPGEKHLIEMKRLLYDDPYENQPSDEIPHGYSLVEARNVSATRTLPSPLLLDLFSMTPYAFRTPAAGKARLAAAESLSLTLAFRVLLYRKN